MDFDSLMKQYAAGGSDRSVAEVAPPSLMEDAHSVKKRAFFRRPPTRQPGSVEDVGGGEYKLDSQYGAYNLWRDEWCGRPDDLVVVFEAKAANDVTVLLSMDKGETSGNAYEIVIGGWKNTKSTFRTEPQGQERATSFNAGMCNADAFLTYWVGLKDGVLAAGTGDKPGKNVILAWKHPQHDPEDAQPCWVAFSSWDNVVHLRNVRLVDSADHDWVQELGDPAEWISKYVPPYIAVFEEERAANVLRSQRFGVKFVPPSAKAVLGQMSHPEREKARASMAGRLRTGFATGFDVESAEERENRKGRAARFGLSESDASLATSASAGLSSTVSDLLPSDEEFASKRSRAARFGLPLNEQVKLVAIAVKVPIRRKDSTPNDTTRNDTLHLFGDLSHITSGNILSAFQDFNPSHLEWLNEYSCNVVFADRYTCDRARTGLCREIPAPLGLPAEAELTHERAQFDAELNKLISGGWKFTAIKDKTNEVQYILVRNATLDDVKPFVDRSSGRPMRKKRDAEDAIAPASSDVLEAPKEEEEEGRKRVRRSDDNGDDAET